MSSENAKNYIRGSFCEKPYEYTSTHEKAKRKILNDIRAYFEECLKESKKENTTCVDDIIDIINDIDYFIENDHIEKKEDCLENICKKVNDLKLLKDCCKFLKDLEKGMVGIDYINFFKIKVVNLMFYKNQQLHIAVKDMLS